MHNCPCKDCICVPVCRHKQYSALIFGCTLLQKYLRNGFMFGEPSRPNGKLKLVQKSLQPSAWILIYDEYGRAMVDNDTGYGNCHFHY
jgi:hypothetical protein